MMMHDVYIVFTHGIIITNLHIIILHDILLYKIEWNGMGMLYAICVVIRPASVCNIDGMSNWLEELLLEVSLLFSCLFLSCLAVTEAESRTEQCIAEQ